MDRAGYINLVEVDAVTLPRNRPSRDIPQIEKRISIVVEFHFSPMSPDTKQL